jgi:hypothetical protein
MRIESKRQAKALRDFRDTLEACSDASFVTLDGDIAADLRAWKRERTAALRETRNAVLNSGVDVPESWLQIEVPQYALVSRPESVAIRGRIDPAIAQAMEQIRLALMRWDAGQLTQEVFRDPQKEARDQWIYEECCRGTSYKNIRFELEKLTDWDSLDSDTAVRNNAISYAERHGLDPIPRRKRGRKPKVN